MPRKAREKSSEYIYHITCRSVSEFLLFRDDDDKTYYLELLKRYTHKYKCRMYAYCLLDNHLHLHLDPMGYDVSKFMHCTNVAYVRYYNKKYRRHGPVFQERFDSRVLSTDEYNLAVSAYIHNNAKDIEGYRQKEHLYRYSSYGIYLGIRKDGLGLIDTSFIMGLFNAASQDEFASRYREFVREQRDMGSSSIKKELSCGTANEYRQGRRIILREHAPSKVISYISDKLMIPEAGSIMLKSKKRVLEFRAFCAYAMRVLCGLGYREICDNIYNMTISGCSRLCSKGYDLIHAKPEYAKIFEALVGQLVM